MSDPDALSEIAITLPSNSMRSRVAQWALGRIQGKTTKEIAEEMDLSPATLNTYAYKARKEGWLKLSEAVDVRLEQEVVPKALENVIEFLEEKDKEVTLAAAKAVVFPRAEKDFSQPTTIIGIKIALPDDEISVEGVIGNPK